MRAIRILVLELGPPAQRWNATRKHIQPAEKTRAELTISGGDALVRIDVPARIPLVKIVVKVNDQVITSDFHADPRSHALVGLVDGSRVGDNSLQVFTDR